MASKKKAAPKKAAKKTSQKNIDPPKFDEDKPLTEEQAAEKRVDDFWTAYDTLFSLLGAYAQYPPSKLIEMHDKGELDLSMSVKVSPDGTKVSVGDFYESANQQIEEALKPKPELRVSLREPLLIEARKSLQMTNTQIIFYGLLKDAAERGAQVFAINRSMKSFTKAMKEQYAAIKEVEKEKEAVVKKGRKSASKKKA